MISKMKAAIFVEPGRIVLDEKPIPDTGRLDALIRTTTTTICGTDIHILKGEYPVKRGLTIGHEPVGVIEKLGSAVRGYSEGQLVIAGAITPSGYSNACLCGCLSQDGADTKHGFKAIGGWKFGNTIDGCHTVAVFAQGPIGLCATAAARLCGASMIISVDGAPARMEMSRRLGADHCVDFKKSDPVDEIMHLTEGRGVVDVAIEALGTQATFEAALRVLRPGGTLSSLGVYSSDLKIPLGPFAAGLADLKIVTALCPGSKERMRRLMTVIASSRADLKPLVTHRFNLDQIEAAYDIFGHQRNGVLKVAITP